MKGTLNTGPLPSWDEFLAYLSAYLPSLLDKRH